MEKELFDINQNSLIKGTKSNREIFQIIQTLFSGKFPARLICQN